MHVCVPMPMGQVSKRTKVVKTQSHRTKRVYTACLSAKYHACEMLVVWRIIGASLSEPLFIMILIVAYTSGAVEERHKYNNYVI